MPAPELFAAVATPVREDGSPDIDTFDRVVDFLVDAGVDGLCVGGATSEYPHFDAAERARLIERAAGRLGGGDRLLVGVGASNVRRTLHLARAAEAVGSRALLVPMPMFFRYGQEDLHAYCAHVSRAARMPCLLYDLPDFTNGLAPETAVALMSREEFIVGLKDSSGRAANLPAFAEARGSRPWTLLVGDDRLLHLGLAAGWNGAISGIACFCPELLVGVTRSFARGDLDRAVRLQQRVDELVARITPFPAPWGIRAGLACRGFDTGPLPLPLSAGRERQIREFREWFTGWLPRALDA